MNHLLERFYPEARFGGFTDCDGTIRFYSRVNTLLSNCSQGTLLDVGCGRAKYVDDVVTARRELRIMKGKCARVVGIDVDPAAGSNPFLDEFYLLQSDRWPLDNNSVDLCLADYVIEHISSADAFFSECRRVIRPTGYLCIRTANIRSYVGLAARLVPNRHHAAVLHRAQESRKAEDVFPTVYGCNTIGKLRGMLDRYGFDAVVYGTESEPVYLAFSPLAYWLGVLHQKYAPSALKSGIFAFGTKY